MNDAAPRQAVMLTTDRRIDRRILLEADALEQAGWAVTVLALDGDPDALDDPRVQRVVTARQDPAAANPTQRWYARMRRWLPDWQVVAMLKELAWRTVVDRERFFSRLFDGAWRGRKARLVVAHDLPTLPAAVQLARDTGAALVYDSHELWCEQGFSRGERLRWEALERACIGRCQGVVTVNPSIAAELQRRYGLAHVGVVMNAEHPLRYEQPPRLFHACFGLPDPARVLLYQGGLMPGRNLEVLLDAFASMPLPEWHLVMMGDGPRLEALQQRARTGAAAARIHFRPAVAQHELLRYSASATVGLVPYRGDCLNNLYCTPNKLFEFVAAGLPVIASDLPELSRLVRGHGFGTTIPFDDARAAAAALHPLLADEARLQQWREAALEARETLCWRVEGARFVAEVDAALSLARAA